MGNRVYRTYITSGAIGNITSSGPHTRVQEYESELPVEEQHNGVQGISVEVYGDSVDSAFLKVHGPDESEVFHKWNQISSLAPEFLKTWWAE